MASETAAAASETASTSAAALEAGPRPAMSCDDAASDGSGEVAVLRVANRSWSRGALEAQDAALEAIAAAGTAAFDAPRPRGRAAVARIGDDDLLVRLLTFVPGVPLTGNGYLAPVVVGDLGRLSGAVAAALAGFEHPGLDRHPGQWDLRRGAEVVATLLPSIPDASKREVVAATVSAARRRMAPVVDRLRVQTIHSDVTDDNVVGTRDAAGRLRPHGIIDFGDLARSWLVGEAAVTASAILRHAPADPLSLLPAIAAFHAQCPLNEDDAAALWPLIVLRGAVLVASGEHQAALDPDNDSATGPLASEWAIFHAARSVPYDMAEAAIRCALAMPPLPAAATLAAAAAGCDSPLLPTIAPPSVAVVDLSATSDALHAGAYLEGAAREAAVLAAASATGTVTATRWGEARLTRCVQLSAEPPATVALGVDLVLPPGTPLVAPWACSVGAGGAGGALVLCAPAGRVLLRGVAGAPAEGTAVAAGAPMGSVGAAGTLWVQLVGGDVDIDAVPSFATPATRAAWTSLCPDPSRVLFGSGGGGIGGGAAAAAAAAVPSSAALSLAAPDDDAAGLLVRREKHFAAVQEHYYAAPMRMERGWREHLLDTGGRSYVDMVNNVAAIGHSHPRLAAALGRQFQLLNTNSRFHYAAVAELSERLAAVAPAGLDTVLLVNSGSEAVDLALRMAQVVTGRMDIIAVREAYHGWTLMSDAVTTSLYDNPRALETRPAWIHLASAPNSYRGTFRGAAAAAGYADDVRGVVAGLTAAGTPPAAFLCQPPVGHAGRLGLPPGHLGAAYPAVRGAGGLVVADEVQVGFGRTGHHWWAFEAHGVVPDMITIAKAMGNGFPLGAVITRRSVVDKFQELNARFFSSAGGSPASCVAGLTVLDVMRDEGLQANAARVGDHLIAACTALMDKYPIIGAVHGSGLYLGVELVKDRATLEPATAECYAICDRLRELGVIVQPTGERTNILKMKPPMCLSLPAADFFVAQLERTLRDGW